jgi:ribonuclease HI
MIYVDSQAIIKAIQVNANNSWPGQYLIKDVIQLAEEANQPRNRDQLRVKWISAHSDVIGNERADEEAKQAAQGMSSPAHLLPPLLRCHLPHSATALKQNQLQIL